MKSMTVKERKVTASNVTADDVVIVLIAAEVAAESAYAICEWAYHAGHKQKDIASKLQKAGKYGSLESAQTVVCNYWPTIVSKGRTGRPQLTTEAKAIAAAGRCSEKLNGDSKMWIALQAAELGVTAAMLERAEKRIKAHKVEAKAAKAAKAKK